MKLIFTFIASEFCVIRTFNVKEKRMSQCFYNKRKVILGEHFTSWRQSYLRELVLKKTQLVLTSWMMRYFSSD